ncbi:MAG: TIGR02206 family membrane protein [Firmicutes bacterium]|nr:TIGR02206 family membrane protein [Bacillota bacterium]
MNNYFTPDYNGEPFELFSTTHIITIIVLALINFFIIFHYKKKKEEEKLKKRFRYILALFLLLNETAYTTWSVVTGDWTPGYSLPLHLCDMAMFFSVIMLISKNYFLYEITYFWGLGGSLQTLITPDLYPYSFPHFIYFNFFFAHSAVVTAVLFMTLVEGFRPFKKSILKAVIFTNIYMVIISAVNILTGGNYLFLCHKPNSPSVIDYLGPWPWYILGLEIVGIAIMCILYMPFFIKDLKSLDS